MQGKVAFITGAGSGIGRATALAYAAKGVTVAAIDLADRGGPELVAAIEARYGTPCCFLEADVTLCEDVRFAIIETVDRYGAINYVFNNACVDGFAAKTADITEENWDGVLNVNLRGAWLCMKYEIHQMLKQGGGAIVNNANVMGMTGSALHAPFVASKHGVIGLTKTAALEYAEDNIRINAICPGVVRNRGVEYFLTRHPEHKDELAEGVPLGRIASPEEIASAVLWLNSEEASYITGDSLVIDGGRLSHA